MLSPPVPAVSHNDCGEVLPGAADPVIEPYIKNSVKIIKRGGLLSISSPLSLSGSFFTYRNRNQLFSFVTCSNEMSYIAEEQRLDGVAHHFWRPFISAS